MPDTLHELCQLVAGLAVAKAEEVANVFQRQLREEAEVQLTDDQLRTVVTGFAFTNWAFANGVWSNLTNTRLRRDLLGTSKNALILATARALCKSDEPSDIAHLATNLDFDPFQPFAQACIERGKELNRSGRPFDANAVLLFGLEWIQTHLGISDAVMGVIVPGFMAEVGDFAEEVERVASQVNRAAGARRKRGLLARLLDGWRSGSASD